MSIPGQKERATQDRVIKLFRDTLGYTFLGNLSKRVDNRNIEEDVLRRFLTDQQKYEPELIGKAVAELVKTAGDASKQPYDRNRAVYDLLRYGVKVRTGVGEQTQTVWLIDWKQPLNNRFGAAEEVTIGAADPKGHTKRPDVVLYVNGIALGVLELKRSTASVGAGIRQNLDSQKKEFIGHFFSTIQFVMAGNDTEGLRYAAIDTPEKYWLTWKEESPIQDPLDRALVQICGKARFLELIHDFIVYDAGIKKIARPNQYFGVRAAQEHVSKREGGIIWHTQGSGKSLTMVWLTRWIREHQPDARILIVTDRTELDEQIETVFLGVNEQIHRTKSGADLITTLNATHPWLICSLIHKFGGQEDGEEVGDIPAYLRELTQSLPPGFAPKGNLFVFVDECHRTQSGDLHEAMKSILPDAMFIGFTGTPLLKSDKRRTIEVFGPYIHTYRFNEAVQDGVVLDLRYEARDIDQHITSQAKIDQWFDAKTKGLTEIARAQLKQRWGTMQKVLSSKSRLEQIVADVLMDMELRERLKTGRGNAMLVTESIHQACRLYELFADQGFRHKCAIITSYRPSVADLKGEDSGEGLNDRLRQYEIYREMLADWFNQPADQAVNRAEEFEREVKKKFIHEPGQMKLLIVVDKLLTGFDAPPATYLYIDKSMRDHGLFQAICRVNRLDGDDKEYGYIIDYKDLFRSLEKAVQDYTSGALDGYDREDVAGLLKDRVATGRERLEEAREAVKALCEPVEPPKDTAAYLAYFCARESGNAAQLKTNEPLRLAFYRNVVGLIRAFANLADEMEVAGYTPAEVEAIRAEVAHYDSVRNEVKRASGDWVDLKKYEPAMRLLLDTYIRAEPTEVVSAFDDLSLVQLIVQRGPGAVDALPSGIRGNEQLVAEVIENNVRRLIIDEQPINPKYYERMSELLDALIRERRAGALDYQEYLRRIVELTKQASSPGSGGAYPASMKTTALRALYDNLEKDEARALRVDAAVHGSRQDEWRSNPFKLRRVRNAIRAALTPEPPSEAAGEPGFVGVRERGIRFRSGPVLEERVDEILTLVQNQDGY
jgi:type I restriction enzyme, R subunit